MAKPAGLAAPSFTAPLFVMGDSCAAPGTSSAPSDYFQPTGAARLLQRQCAACAQEEGAPSILLDDVQAKLMVGGHDDPLEREADQVAASVLAQAGPSPVPVRPSRVSRSEPAVRRAASGAPAHPSASQKVGEVLRSDSGRPLDASTRAYFEPRFGHDFSRVRIHADEQAHTTAQALGARAFTHGNDIVFARGVWPARSSADWQTLTHELTHVTQAALPGVVMREDAQQAKSSVPPAWFGTRADNATPVPPMSTSSAAGLGLASNPGTAPSLAGIPGRSGAGQEGAPSASAEPARETSPILGLPPDKVQAALEAALARVEGAGERAREQQAETRAKQVPWGLFDVPIDDRLLSARSINQELTIRFFQAVLGRKGVTLEPWMAENILARLDWKYLVGEQKARELVAARLATGVHTIPYESNSETASAVVEMYYTLLAEYEERLRRTYEELHKTHYAEQALLSFYIAHVNGLISVLNGLLDLPVAPINLVQSLRGKETYKFLGRIPPIPYVGAYGEKYGHTMETGVVLGLLLAPGGQAGAGATLGLSAARGEAALAETTSAAIPFLSRLLSSVRAWSPILKVTRWALTGVGLSAAGQGAVDIVKAVQALRSGVVVKPDGTVKPLTEDEAFQLMEAILVSALILKMTVKGIAETREGPAEKEAPPGLKKEQAPPPELKKEAPPEGMKESPPELKKEAPPPPPPELKKEEAPPPPPPELKKEEAPPPSSPEVKKAQQQEEDKQKAQAEVSSELPKTLGELLPRLSEKAQKAFKQQRELLSEERFRQMEGAFTNRVDGTYDVARANKFFESKLVADSEFEAKISARNAEFANKAKQEIDRIKNSVEETNGTNRPGSTLGDGTSEAALAWEIEKGEPYKSAEGHYQKIANYIATIQDAIDRLGIFRKYITEPTLLSEIDKAFQSGLQRVGSMRPVLDQWNQRARTYPDVWNPDGTSKVKPGWPSDTSSK